MHMAILVIENHSIKYQDDPPKEEVNKRAEVEKKKETVTSWWVHFTADQSYK